MFWNVARVISLHEIDSRTSKEFMALFPAVCFAFGGNSPPPLLLISTAGVIPCVRTAAGLDRPSPIPNLCTIRCAGVSLYLKIMFKSLKIHEHGTCTTMGCRPSIPNHGVECLPQEAAERFKARRLFRNLRVQMKHRAIRRLLLAGQIATRCL